MSELKKVFEAIKKISQPPPPPPPPPPNRRKKSTELIINFADKLRKMDVTADKSYECVAYIWSEVIDPLQSATDHEQVREILGAIPDDATAAMFMQHIRELSAAYESER